MLLITIYFLVWLLFTCLTVIAALLAAMWVLHEVDDVGPALMCWVGIFLIGFGLIYAAGVGVKSHYLSHVYVPENTVVLTFRSDGSIALYDKQGLYAVEPFEYQHIWVKNTDSVTLSANENTSIFNSGGDVVIGEFDFSQVKPIKAYRDFGCASDYCLMSMIISEMRNIYFDQGCEGLVDGLNKYKDYGINLKRITYCR